MSDSITFLGTADGQPSAERRQAALLLQLAGQNILVDCGEPVSQTLRRMGYDGNSLDAVVVTHAHSDHIGGLPMLVQACWLHPRTRPLPVFLPPGIIQPFRDWLRACYVFEEDLPFELQVRPITAGAFRAYPTTHLEGARRAHATQYPHVSFEAYAVVFEAGSRRIGYSGDLGAPEDLAPLFPLDLLVCELAHFHPQALADFLKDKPVNRLILTHLSRPMYARVPQVQAILPAAIIARDGDTFSC